MKPLSSVNNHFSRCIRLSALLLAAAPGFAVPGFAAPPPVTLEALLAEAIRVNPQLAAARSSAEAAQQMEHIEGALPDPEFVFQYMVTPAETRAGPIRYRFELEQMVPFWGIRGFRREAARKEAKAIRLDSVERELDVLSELAVAFHDWDYAEAALRINFKNRDLLNQLRELAEQLYAAGQVPQSDTLKAVVEIARADVADAGFRRMSETAQAEISAILNRPLAVSLGQPLTADMNYPVPDLDSLAARALVRRPDLLAAEAMTEAEQARLDLARREYWPDLKLGAMYAPVKGGTNPTFMADGDDDFAIKAGINIPLQIGRRRAAVAGSTARLEARRHEREALKVQLIHKIHERHERVRETEAVLDLYRSRIRPAAELELESAREGYVTGRLGFIGLLDSQRSYIGVLFEEAAARRDHRQELARLFRTAGLLPTGQEPAGSGEPPSARLERNLP